MGQDLDRLLKTVENRYNHAQSIQLDFSETYAAHHRPAQTESGVLYLRKPGRMRWEYSSPAGKVFLSDGKERVFIYARRASRREGQPEAIGRRYGRRWRFCWGNWTSPASSNLSVRGPKAAAPGSRRSRNPRTWLIRKWNFWRPPTVRLRKCGSPARTNRNSISHSATSGERGARRFAVHFLRHRGYRDRGGGTIDAMSEFVLKYADARARSTARSSRGNSGQEIRERYSKQGFLVYSVEAKAIRHQSFGRDQHPRTAQEDRHGEIPDLQSAVRYADSRGTPHSEGARPSCRPADRSEIDAPHQRRTGRGSQRRAALRSVPARRAFSRSFMSPP